ncbi:hypothetical protein L6452_00487 [Arctium lappa]|uniref:Uncharacterized protein n=1 Tax=Arctium lappa TaxID=4217 RepID=A0ACB9FEV7_ARCLA|nr:hypothetical protein L6452_00487 [Arctium lappa]
MANNFQVLPPHKRFRLMHQEKPAIDHNENRLPAKKRKESRLPLPFAATTTAYCLPAKKRITALHPNFLPEKPISSFDLNLEYDPKSDENISSVSETVSETGAEKIDIREEEEEDGIMCAVCQSTDGDPLDPIVFCDGCDLMVHTTCYGEPLTKGVPEGDWFCSQCQIGNNNNKGLPCCLCPIVGGALKPTNNGEWAHIVCALFIPEVFFSDPIGREGIDCSRVPSRRWGRRCYVCKESNGCVVDCSEEKCCLSFHVTCGLKEDVCIEYKEARNKEVIVAGFCKRHSDLWMKQQATGRYKIVARSEEK